MAPTFPLLIASIFFALLSVPCLLALVLGVAFRVETLKWIGGVGLLICALFIGGAVAGVCQMAAVDSVTAVAGPDMRTRPRQEDMTGTYRLTPSSARFVKRKGYANLPDICIILSADGTFEMQNMPDMWHNAFGRPNRKFDSGCGTWKLDSHDAGLATHPGITLDFDDVRGFSSSVYKNGFVSFGALQLKNQKKPYRLQATIGDPDSGETLEFEKAPPSTLEPTLSEPPTWPTALP